MSTEKNSPAERHRIKRVSSSTLSHPPLAGLLIRSFAPLLASMLLIVLAQPPDDALLLSQSELDLPIDLHKPLIIPILEYPHLIPRKLIQLLQLVERFFREPVMFGAVLLVHLDLRLRPKD
jgi:hypothetical protein